MRRSWRRSTASRLTRTANVLVTSGATGALHAAIMATLDPGDECIVFEPFYGYHTATLSAQRVKPVIVPLAAPDWTLDLDRLRAAITPRTRGMILNTPANPSGKVFSRTELEAIAELAIEHDLFVFTDEIYEYFLYDGERHISLATLPGMAERTITLSGFSKTFSVTGWRLGLPDRLRAVDSGDWLLPRSAVRVRAFAAAAWRCCGTAGAAVRASTTSSRWSTRRSATAFCAALARAGMTPSIPTGAYYVLADASRIEGANAKAKARKLLADTGLAAVAGSAFFGADEDGRNRGEHLLRFCFAKKDEDLAEACRRLDEYR